MKNYLLYFFAFLSLTLLLPVFASLFPKGLTEIHDPSVEIEYSDGTKEKMPIEDYVFKVLIGLADKDTGYETLKALAVAVRSCAFYIIRNGCNHKNSDVCDKSGCCFEIKTPEKVRNEFPDSADEIIAKAKYACEKTEGYILTYKNMPAMALFHTSSGRKTADCKKFPYLVSVENIDESLYFASKSEKHFEYKEFADLTGFDIKSAENAEKCCTVYGSDGRAQLVICGKKTLSGAETARRLCLPSEDFEFTYTDTGIDVLTSGKGRGYGMSFFGARALEKEGKTFEEIIGFYYPKLSLNKIYNN